MIEDDPDLVRAQRILDEKCDGDLAKAFTYAAFRGYTRGYLRRHWPVVWTKDNEAALARRLEGPGGRLEE